MKIDHLPPEILVLVLRSLGTQSDLYECALACKNFHEGAIPLLWRTPDLATNDQFAKFMKCLAYPSSSLINNNIPAGHWVRRFKVTLDIRAINDNDCIYLMRHMPFLEEFIVENSERLTDKSIVKLPRHCSLLQELHLERANITYRSAHHLGPRLTRLKRLTLRDCARLQPQTLLPFAECPLESLDLSGSKWLNAEDTAYDLWAFNRLRHLDIVCSDQTDSNTTVLTRNTGGRGSGAFSGRGISEFMQRLLINDETGEVVMPLLQSFSMTGGSTMGDADVVPFIKLHPHLEYVTLMACAITDAALSAILDHLPNLQFLDISYCPDITQAGVRRLIRNSCGLEMIGLKGCGIPTFEELRLTRHSMVDRLGQTEIGIIRSYREPHPQDVIAPQEQSSGTATAATVAAQEMHDHSIFAAYAAIQRSLDANLL